MQHWPYKRLPIKGLTDFPKWDQSKRKKHWLRSYTFVPVIIYNFTETYKMNSFQEG